MKYASRGVKYVSGFTPPMTFMSICVRGETFMTIIFLGAWSSEFDEWRHKILLNICLQSPPILMEEDVREQVYLTENNNKNFRKKKKKIKMSFLGPHLNVFWYVLQHYYEKGRRQ